MTDFVQKLNYQRAIQGELSRTIQSLASVEKARVHIVIAKKSIFSEQEENPSASVVLKLRPGRTLTENQVTAIAQLVSSSVPGLGVERVSVIDSAGTLLSKVRPTGDGAGSTEAMGVQRGLEMSLEERARAILEKTVGSGRVVVRVASDIEQKKVESTEEKYDPDSVVVRSEQRSAEKNSGSSGAPSGIPGTPSNVPNAQGQPAAAAVSTASGASNSSSRNNETINYEVSRTVSKSSAPIVAVKRLTVAVLVDGSYKVTKDAKGNESSTYVPRTAEELSSYERLVKNAVGFTQDRGDTFEIVSAPFLSDENLPAAAAAAKPWPVIPTSYISMARPVATLLLALLLVMLVVRPLIKWISTPQPLAPPTGDMYAYAVPGAVSAPAGESELTAAAGRPSALGAAKDDVAALAQREPQRAAQAVKMWLIQG
jgi:flagellar M-ring protein FliF